MKCKYCGAEIKEGSSICEYCDSAVEKDIPKPQTIIIEEKSSLKGIMRVIGKVIIGLGCIWGVVIVISLIAVLNSDTFKEINKYSAGTSVSYEIPANETRLMGQIVSCDEDGIASIEYKDHIYENVKILDKALIEWLNETGKKIDTVGICFSTDGKGNISEIGLFSANFFVTEKQGERYTAIREGNVISFTSVLPLETDCYYSGYFSYPDVHLYWGEKENPMVLSYMDLKCTDKVEEIQQEYYTGDDIAVYRIYIEGNGYYCSKETYDTVQIGDLLNEYKLCEEQELAFVVKE